LFLIEIFFGQTIKLSDAHTKQDHLK